MRRSTISDVAEAARVSISTVSLVINGKGPVATPTRERVLKEAERLGFVPSRAAQQLVGGRTGNVGFVLRESHFSRSEPFYTRIFLGAEFEARQQSVYVLLATIPDAYDPARDCPRFLRERSVDGLLVAGRVDPAFLDDVAGRAMPAVLVDYERDPFPTVTMDNAGGARQAIEHLRARGHRRIAFVGADQDHPSLHARLAGFREAAGDAAGPVLFPGGEPTRLLGQQLAPAIFAATPRPTAVFCANDAVALGVLDAARTHGLAVPGDLAVVGFDDVEGAAHAVPPLTTVRVFKEQLGEVALRLLAEHAAGTDAEPRRYARAAALTRIATELVVRGST